MVKNFTMQGRLEFAGPEIIFNHLFGDDQFIRSFHKKINHDPYAEASCWNINGEREVKYMASSEAPKMIMKLVGADSFPVKEVQKYTRNGSSITISCEPVIESTGGDRFITCAETILSPDERGGCAVTSNVILEFKGGLWGVEGAVEGFMESKARTTFDDWMMTARLFCQEKLGLSMKKEEENNQEEYFDAEDRELINAVSSTGTSDHPSDCTSLNRIFSRFRSALLGNQEGPGLNMFFVRTMSKDISDIQICCDASRSHLEKLNAKMLKMEDNLASITSLLERQPTSVSSGNEWTMFGLGVAVGLATGFIYLQARKHT